MIVLYVVKTTDEMIYEKADWEAFIGAERNEYYKWPRVEEGEPELVGAPPRRPPVTDVAIDPHNLTVGEEYPGVFEGSVYSVDTQLGITDEEGRPQRSTPALHRTLETWLPHGGRFAVTPSRQFLIKMERKDGNSRIVFLGSGPDPLFEPDSVQTESHQFGDISVEPGSKYPFPVADAKQFSVLQRDVRLIAEKAHGRVKFVVRPENVADPEKAARLGDLIFRLRETYQSGRQINKIFVTATGDVIYPYHGAYYFVGKAPEGKDGFVFE